jgi:dipeptide/tripeptide permease
MWNRLNLSMMFCQAMFGLSFYGAMVILTRFFLVDLGYDEAKTMMIVGAFSAIGPLFAIAGGLISDKMLGANRALLIAYAGFATGYVLLVEGAISKSIPLSMTGIALASYARGLMSPSYPSLFKRTFSSEESFEKGYPINYSVNNLGALFGQYLYPLLVLTIAFKGGFLLSAVMAIAGFIVLLVQHKSLANLGADLDKNPVALNALIKFLIISAAMVGLVFFMFSNMDIGQYVVYAIGGSAILYFFSLMLTMPKSDGLRIAAILIMSLLTTFFFVYYGQMMTSMNMVAMNTMKGDLFGFIPLAPEANLAMNPFWCILGGPLISGVFAFLEKRKINIPTAIKISGAFVLTALAFGFLTYTIKAVGPSLSIRPEMFFIVHGLQGIAEVIVGSMVVAFILSVAPKKIENFAVSLFSIALSVSGIIGAVFSTSIAMEKGQSLTLEYIHNVYGGYFYKLTIFAVFLVVLAIACSFLITKMLNKAKEIEKLTAFEKKKDLY